MATPQELKDAMAEAAERARQPVPQPPPSAGERLRTGLATQAANERVQMRVATNPVRDVTDGVRLRQAADAAAAREPTFSRIPAQPRIDGAPTIRESLAAQARAANAAKPFYDRPINPKPAMDAAKASGRLVQRAVAPLARVAGPVALAATTAAEGAETARDVQTPGMTAIDKTARVAEGGARVLGSAALGVKGAAAGASLGTAILPGPGTVIGGALGGIAGGAAGYFAPDAANNVYNWAKRKFGSDDENQLASARAAELQAQQQPAASPVVPVAAAAPVAPAVAPVAAPARIDQAPARRPKGGPARPARPRTATAAAAAAPAIAAAPEPETGQAPVQSAAPAFADHGGLKYNQYNENNFVAVSPTGEVTRGADAVPQLQRSAEANAPQLDRSQIGMMSYGSRPEQAMVQLADGRVVRGFDAMALANQAMAADARQPQPASVQPVYTNAPNTVRAMPGSNVQVVGPGERFAASSPSAVPESITDAKVPAYNDARTEYAIDRVNPNAAKLRDESALENVRGGNRLKEQALQNQGSATSASISAGPGHANAKTAAERLEFEKKQDRVKIIGGGQEPVFDPATGMYVGMRTVPQRAIRQRGNGDEPAPTWEDAMAPPAASAAPVKGKTYTDAKGRKATWDGKQYVPVK